MKQKTAMRFWNTYWIILLLGLMQMAEAQTVSPRDFGWDDATTDSARFWVLYNTHVAAIQSHSTVSYQGMDTLDIEIPSNAKSIPLGDSNHFADVVFRVKNTHKNLFLFSRIRESKPIAVADNDLLCQCIENKDFSPIPELSEGRYLLHITDSNAWVGQRANHAYGHYREDLTFITNGHGVDPTTAPYLSHNSQPHCKIVSYDMEEITFYFGHLTLIRDSLASHRTYLLDIQYLVSPIISHVSVYTPASMLVDDCIMRIYHCYMPNFYNIHIQGSYSRTNRSGYGILMNNCFYSQFNHLYARTPWGVFGTNNMNNVVFRFCDFDRFDIHCYGRDIFFYNCRQQDSYNQYSSTFGIISHENCHFDNFTPVLIESSYNAYNHFELWVENCTWHLTPERNYLMDAGPQVRATPIRQELEPYCLPSVRISNSTITTDKKVREMHLFHFRGQPVQQPIQATSYIDLDNISCPKKLKIELTQRKYKDISFQEDIQFNLLRTDLKNTIIEKNIVPLQNY